MTVFVYIFFYNIGNLKKGCQMSTGLISVASSVVNSVWSVGSEAVKLVSKEVEESIREEALSRTHKHFKKQDNALVDEESELFRTRYKKELKKVSEEYKSLALKGGLIVFGLGFLA
jgi:hypothetical protein